MGKKRLEKGNHKSKIWKKTKLKKTEYGCLVVYWQKDGQVLKTSFLFFFFLLVQRENSQEQKYRNRKNNSNMENESKEGYTKEDGLWEIVLNNYRRDRIKKRQNERI